jgi:hypothetical protein
LTFGAVPDVTVLYAGGIEMKRVVTLAAVVAICTIAFAGAAQASLALEGVGGHVSIVSPDNVDATIGIGFLMDMGFVGTQFGMETFAAYWSQTESGFGVEASVSDFVIGGRGKYRFLTSSPSLHPYVGAGLGLHFVTAGVEIAPIDLGGVVIPGESFEDTEFRLGLDLGGGLAFDVGDRVALLGDSWVSLVEDVSQFTVRLGMLYRLR